MFWKKISQSFGYYKHLIHILSTIGNRGHAIIIGRGANFLFPNALKVRIICEMDERIKKVMKYEKLSRKEAIELINESDKKRRDFSKSLFLHDPTKAHHYDLIIRTGKDISLKMPQPHN
jgi:cytidylate kinase